MNRIMLLIAVIMMIAMACCTMRSMPEYNKPNERNHVIALPGYDIDSLYAVFDECSKDQGDLGCDSCWQLIMRGKVDDSYWKNNNYFRSFDE